MLDGIYRTAEGVPVFTRVARPHRWLRAKQLELANEVARVLSTALMTFLSLCVYVGIIVASTTDEMLVKATTVTMGMSSFTSKH